jgi:DnaJ-class molecular chaperone
MKDLYEILQVNQKASKEVIEKVYRFLAKKYHPDLNPQSKELMSMKMTEINKAYEILGNEFKRLEYDKFLLLQDDKSQSEFKCKKKSSFKVFINNTERKVINILFKVGLKFLKPHLFL